MEEKTRLYGTDSMRLSAADSELWIVAWGKENPSAPVYAVSLSIRSSVGEMANDFSSLPGWVTADDNVHLLSLSEAVTSPRQSILPLLPPHMSMFLKLSSA